uniref:Uncharacterized protein n=1 Tax=Anopheles quadriannulatus TaxID=34691 RepID=A0A182XU48_ANOQN
MANNKQVKDCMLCRDEMVESTDKAILGQEATQYFPGKPDRALFDSG